MRAVLLACTVAADMLAVMSAGVAGSLLQAGRPGLSPYYWGHIALACVTFVLVMQLAGMYRFSALRRRRVHLLRLTGLWVAVIVLLAAAVHPAPGTGADAVGWLLRWALAGWCALLATRLLAWRAIRHFRPGLVTRVAVVGQAIAVERCARSLLADQSDDVEIVARFEALAAPGRPVGQDGAVLARLRAADTRIDEIVFALGHGESLDLDAALARLHPRVADIKLCLETAISSQPGAIVLVPAWRRPLAGLPTVVKRAIDLVAGSLLLVFVLPLMVVIAALVKLDSPGPALFCQQRFGINRKPFRLYKFRSMHCHAGSDPAVPQARRHDPRVTRVGRFLRRTSLDELPQLLNVIGGEMTLVGPRPHPIPLDEKYAPLIEGYLARHHVKPGITGWAQVRGWRGETDTLEKMEQRIGHDLYYIDHWSLGLDFTILLKTLMVVFGHRNAY